MPDLELTSHRLADLFPMMSEAEMEALTADIAAMGLLRPIVLFEGKVLDGKCRLLACRKAGVEPTFVEYKGDDPFGFVLSANVKRRVLTPGQKALGVAKILALQPERRGRPRKGEEVPVPAGRSSAAAAARYAVGEEALQQAMSVLKEAPDLADRVECGSLSIGNAYRELQARREQARQQAADLRRVARYSVAIHDGEMTLEQALERVRAEERGAKEEVARVRRYQAEFLAAVEHVGELTRAAAVRIEHGGYGGLPRVLDVLGRAEALRLRGEVGALIERLEGWIATMEEYLLDTPRG
jgi:hypothetical protein